MKKSTRMMLIGFVGIPLLAAGARAEVRHSSLQGFVVSHVVTVEAPAAKVYTSMHRDIGRWWHKDHTFSGEPHRLSIDPRAGGCFCETLPGGGSVRHLAVVLADTNRRIRMQGGLGPMQGMAVTGSLTWEVSEAQAGTEVTWTYAVGGYQPGGLETLATAVDRVLGEQVMRLKNFVEKGTPTP